MYEGRSIGRLINYLERYRGSTLAHNVVFTDNNSITLYGKHYASYSWKYDDVPQFVFNSGEKISREKEIETIKDIWGWPRIIPPNDTYKFLGKLKVREVFEKISSEYETFLSLNEFRFFLKGKREHSINLFGLNEDYPAEKALINRAVSIGLLSNNWIKEND